MIAGMQSSPGIERSMRISNSLGQVKFIHFRSMLQSSVVFSQLQLANKQPGIDVTIPNDQSKVQYLLQCIKCDDVGLKSRMEIV